MWSGLNWLRIGSNGDFCESNNEASGYRKGWEFLDQLRDYQLLNKVRAPWS
jgi:hypothetical protein